jgi:hypothetical protein
MKISMNCAFFERKKKGMLMLIWHNTLQPIYKWEMQQVDWIGKQVLLF